MNRNIVLVGFMGVGKSLVANKLAIQMNRTWVATDQLVEQKAGKSIPEIFKENGESEFRKMEHNVVKDLAQKQNLVIDCGGGVVLNPQNVELLRKSGILFYLAASEEELYRRAMKATNRPLLDVPDPKAKIKEFLKARTPQYQQADHTIDTSQHSVDQTVSEILKLLANE